MTVDAPSQAHILPQSLDETLVTAVTFETLAQQSVIVIHTTGAFPRVQVTPRQSPERLALMIHGARLDLTHDQEIPVADPRGIVTKLVAFPSDASGEAQVEIVVHLQTSIPFKVQQDQHVVRLALTATAPETPTWTPSPLPLAVQTTPSAVPLAVLPVSSNTVEPVMASQPAMVAPVTSASPKMVLPAVPEQTPVGGLPLVAQVRPRPPTTPSPAVRAREAPRQYTGEKISLDFQDADIKDLLRLIAEVSGVNIIAGGDVQGTVTTRMVDVPWDQALEVILKINGLDQEREGNIIRVAPLERFTKEREERLKAQTTEQQTEPLVTRVVPINYTAAGTLKANLEKLLSDRGSLFVDDRTNNMIVTDRQSNITDMLGLIETLDRPTPQVMIEARIVESSRNFLRELGVQIGLLYSQTTDQAFPSRIAVRGARTPPNEAPGAIAPPPANFLVDLPAAIASGAGGGIGLTLASVGGSLLDIQLSALEASGRGKVISSPRIATLDNTEAVIQSGQRIPYATISQEGTRTEFVDASLSLKVTPHVTPNDFISLEVTATRNAANFSQTSGGVPSIDTREATTKLLVKDGDTVVIGGLYTRTINDSKDGVPYLSKVPILGWLFQTTRTQDDTQELLIFITPRIIRQAPETPGKTRAVVQ
jgi:type IV pilus assembly protein PilQ